MRDAFTPVPRGLAEKYGFVEINSTTAAEDDTDAAIASAHRNAANDIA